MYGKHLVSGIRKINQKYFFKKLLFIVGHYLLHITSYIMLQKIKNTYIKKSFFNILKNSEANVS